MKGTALLVVTALALAAVPAAAQQGAADAAETRTVSTDLAFDTLVERVRAAVADQGMGVVAEACASCGAGARGVDIAGNRVIMVFRNDFAVRMLQASVPAGIAAPLRFYVTEDDAGADLTWQVPSVAFAAYGSADLDRVAAELDPIFAAIADQAVGNHGEDGAPR